MMMAGEVPSRSSSKFRWAPAISSSRWMAKSTNIKFHLRDTGEHGRMELASALSWNYHNNCSINRHFIVIHVILCGTDINVQCPEIVVMQ